ncbi:hypothetical protein BHE74_00035389, partial [Ensete ventricosum]
LTTLTDDGKFLLAARKCRRPTCTDYLISLDADDMSRTSATYIGKLRSNFLGTKFTIYDAQPPHAGAMISRSHSTRGGGSEQISPKVLAGNYPVAHIAYELNVSGSRGPRRMQCVMDSIPASAIKPGECLSGSFSGMSEEKLVLKNKNPRWHAQLQCWCLNFRGRVTVASVKNFQLVASAFAICLSSFDTKIACE